jgi:hypothetical protein
MPFRTAFALALLVLLLGAYASAAPPRSDDFRSGIAPFWKLTQTVGSQSLPPPLTGIDDGRLILRSANQDIWDRTWEPVFLNQKASGDFRLEVTVHSVPSQDRYSGVGLMVAQRTYNFVRAPRRIPTWYMVLVTRANGAEVKFGGRGFGTSRQFRDLNRLPCRLRLDRRGSAMRAAYSPDEGVNWTDLGPPVDLGAGPFALLQDPVLVGIAAQTHAGQALGTAEVGAFYASALTDKGPTTPPPASARDQHVTSLGFSSDGNLLVAGMAGAQQARIFEVGSGRMLEERHFGGLRPGQMLLLPTRDTISVGDGGPAELARARLQAGSTVAQEPLLFADLHDLSPDGRLLALSESAQGKIVLQDEGSGKPVREIRPQDMVPARPVFSPRGDTLAVTCAAGNVRLFAAATGQERGLLQPVPPPTSYERYLFWVVAATMLLLAFYLLPFLAPLRGLLRVRPPRETWRCQDCRYEGPSDDFSRSAASPEADGSGCPKCGSRYVEIRRSASGLGALPRPVRWLLVAELVGLAAFVSLSAKVPMKAFRVSGVAFAPSGDLMATTGEAVRIDGNVTTTSPQVWLWSETTRKPLQVLEGCRLIAFAPKGISMLVAGEESSSGPFRQIRYASPRLLDTRTRRPIATLTQQTGWLRTFAFSSDGRLLATANGPKVLLWDAVSGKLVRTL